MAWAVSRDRTAGLLKVECFKSRFAEEFSLTLRPELGGRGTRYERGERGPSVAMLPRDANPDRIGDFVVTDAPEIDAERSDVEKLADAIRRTPGQSKERLVKASGVALGRARSLLERYDQQLWRSVPGPRRAILYFPSDTPPAEGSSSSGSAI